VIAIELLNISGIPVAGSDANHLRDQMMIHRTTPGVYNNAPTLITNSNSIT
jgi:hypothetical protein